MDASSGDRVGRLLPVGEAADTFIAIDHHTSFAAFAPIVHVDAARPATGLLALDLIDELGVPLTPDMALCSLRRDQFGHRILPVPHHDPETLRAAARLMETGMDFAGAARAMFDTKSRDFLALQAYVMSRLELLDAGGVQVAVVHVDREDRTRSASPSPRSSR